MSVGAKVPGVHSICPLQQTLSRTFISHPPLLLCVTASPILLLVRCMHAVGAVLRPWSGMGQLGHM